MRLKIIVILVLIIPLVFAHGQSSFSGMENPYHIRSWALINGGGLIAGGDNDLLNPAELAAVTQRYLDFSLLSYPADITSGMARVQMPYRQKIISVAVRQLNYGQFDGYDGDGEATGSYTSGDIWITTAIAGQMLEGQVLYGLTTGAFFSQLEDYRAAAIQLTPGLILNLTDETTRVGLVLRNAGFVVENYTTANEKLPTSVAVTLGRQLAHLPLLLNLELDYRLADDDIEIGLGGLFALSDNFNLRVGTSSRKFDQAPGDRQANDLLGSSGLALSYTGNSFGFDVGGSFYGAGAWVTGIGLGVLF